MAEHPNGTHGSASGSCCQGGGQTNAMGHRKPDARASAIDPVCGMAVDPATAKHSHLYRGVTHYFCAARCREKFAAAPERYLDPTEQGTQQKRRRHLHLPDAS